VTSSPSAHMRAFFYGVESCNILPKLYGCTVMMMMMMMMMTMNDDDDNNDDRRL